MAVDRPKITSLALPDSFRKLTVDASTDRATCGRSAKRAASGAGTPKKRRRGWT